MSEKYELIDTEKATETETGEKKYTIIAMCRWLEVSTSGYYEWLDRPESATTRRRRFLELLVKKAFDDSDETYGHRRVHAQLARWDEHPGPELVRGIMRELGLVPCQPRPWRHNLTESDPSAGPIPDLVCRDFTAAAPGRKMVGSDSPGGSHPRAPTDPGVTVSRHRALVALITRTRESIATG